MSRSRALRHMAGSINLHALQPIQTGGGLTPSPNMQHMFHHKLHLNCIGYHQRWAWTSSPSLSLRNDIFLGAKGVLLISNKLVRCALNTCSHMNAVSCATILCKIQLKNSGRPLSHKNVLPHSEKQGDYPLYPCMQQYSVCTHSLSPCMALISV